MVQSLGPGLPFVSYRVDLGRRVNLGPQIVTDEIVVLFFNGLRPSMMSGGSSKLCKKIGRAMIS